MFLFLSYRIHLVKVDNTFHRKEYTCFIFLDVKEKKEIPNLYSYAYLSTFNSRSLHDFGYWL